VIPVLQTITKMVSLVAGKDKADKLTIQAFCKLFTNEEYHVTTDNEAVRDLLLFLQAGRSV
jgi:hypothetical protein